MWGIVNSGEFMAIHSVRLKDRAKKDLRTVPDHIVTKLMGWVRQVEKEGLEKTRRTPGYHDEPLRGNRSGQRSIRLNRAYRAIYEIQSDQTIEFVSIEEVNKHDY